MTSIICITCPKGCRLSVDEENGYKVTGNGCGVAGTPLAYVDEQTRRLLDEADVILAKGQGNFETMHGCGLNVYYSFLCKCDWFQQRFGMEKNKGMFVRERSQ